MGDVPEVQAGHLPAGVPEHCVQCAVGAQERAVEVDDRHPDGRVSQRQLESAFPQQIQRRRRCFGGHRGRSGGLEAVHMGFGATEVVPLRTPDSGGTHRIEFRLGLHAFGNGGGAGLRRKFADGLRQSTSRSVAVDVADDRLVDLDEFRVQLEHVRERREAGADVVDSHPNASCSAYVQRVVESTVVLDGGMFGDLQDDSRRVHAVEKLRPGRVLHCRGRDVDRDEHVVG